MVRFFCHFIEKYKYKYVLENPKIFLILPIRK